MNLVFRSIIFSLFVLYTPCLWQKVISEFRLGKLALDLPYHVAWDSMVMSGFKMEGVYRYLSHGAQSFVFQSTDGKWTLKLFRHHRWIHPWRKMIRNNILQKKQRLPFDQKIDRLFCSTKLAFEQAADLTGLVYVHLNRTEHLPKITLINAIGRKERLDLNRAYFVIQRRAQPIREVFFEAIHEGDRMRFRRLAHSFIQLILERTARGIRNTDTKVAQNFGFWKDHALEWDFGNYRMDPEVSTQEGRLCEINRFILEPEKWLKDFPEWIDEYRKEKYIQLFESHSIDP